MLLRTTSLLLLSLPALSQSETWRYYRPGNTGIQGDLNEAVFVGPDGDPIIGGYDPSFEEGGFAKFVQAENRWINVSNIDYPVIGHPNLTGTARVSDIVSDPSGVLWLSTWRGLLRYDPAIGPSSVTNLAAQIPVLVNGGARDIDRAPDGSLWIALLGQGGAQGGLLRYQPATGASKYWTGGATPTGGDGWPQLIWNVGNVAVQPKPGGGYLVWCDADNGASQAIFDSQTGAFSYQEFSFTPGSILEFLGKDSVDDTGHLWARRFVGFSGSNAVYSIDYRRPDGTWVTPAQPALAGGTPAVWAFKAFGDRQALLADGAGRVRRFNGSAWLDYGVWNGGGGFTNSLDIDASGNVWVAGSGGAAKRSAASGTWQRYRVTNTSQFDSFNNSLAIDAVGGRLAACANAGPGFGGMVLFDGQRWTGFNNFTYGLGKPWPFPTDNSEALTFRAGGSIAVNPMFNGIRQWDGAAWTNLNGPSESLDLAEDSLGRLWSLGDYFSLRYLAGGVWTEAGLIGLGRELRLDPELPGTVWAASSFEIKRTDGVASFARQIDDFPMLSTQSDTFSGLAIAPGGIAWFGASVQLGLGGSGGALFRLDANTGQYQVWRHDQGWPFPGQFVQPLACTPDGRLWMQYDSDFLTAQRGLCWWDGQNVGVYPAPPFGEPQWGGLPHAQIAALEVLPIPGGYELWMSCKSRGLAVLKVQKPGSISAFGCGQNPAGSLLASGSPSLGGSLGFALDNPLGSQAPGAASLLVLSTSPAGSPCGLPVPGWNMAPAAPTGELLVGQPFALSLAGAPWAGPGQPVSWTLPVPNQPNLIGVRFYAQGALIDPTGTGPLVGLSEGRLIRVGL